MAKTTKSRSIRHAARKGLMTQGAELSVAPMTDLKRQGAIRVVIPSEVAFNIGKLNRTMKDLVSVLGCPACCSGFDVTFMTSEFVVDPKSQKVRPL